MTPTGIQRGEHPVTFVAKDGESSATQTITIRVIRGAHPPSIKPIDREYFIKARELLEIGITAYDEDQDDITLSAMDLPDGAVFTIGTSVPGRAEGMFRWEPDDAHVGEYHVEFRASSGTEWAEENVSIKVAPANHPPALNRIGDQRIREGERLTLEVSAADGDEETLILRAETLPLGATFEITRSERGEVAGVLSWAPEYTQSGEYPVTFMVSDRELTTQERIVIRVEDVNRAPVLNPIGNQTIREGEELVLNISATEPDQDEAILQAYPLPVGASFEPL